MIRCVRNRATETIQEAPRRTNRAKEPRTPEGKSDVSCVAYVCVCVCVVVSQKVQLWRPRRPSEDMGRAPTRCLLRQHVPNFLVAEQDLVDWLSSVFQRSVLAIDVRRHKDLGVPGEALAGGKVRDLRRSRSVRTPATVHHRVGRRRLTSRGGPSGSPMLIKVHSSLLKAVPE